MRKRIGFLSFGHWQNSPGSRTRTAADALNQTIELAEAAEEIGIDGAFVRVHHFARQLASPFPLLSAIGVKVDLVPVDPTVFQMHFTGRTLKDLWLSGRAFSNLTPVSLFQQEMNWEAVSLVGAPQDPEKHARDHRANELDYLVLNIIHVDDDDLLGLDEAACSGLQA